MLEIKNLAYHVNKKTILNEINVTFEKGIVHCIMSPSGFGKSTLIKCISGRLKYEGEITLDDEKFLGCGYMNQELYLMESLNVLETIRFYHQCSTRNIFPDSFYENYLLDFGIDKTLMYRPIGNNISGGLSGGEKKRLLLACHLLRNLPVLILDEPLTGLDENTSLKIFNIINNHVSKHQNICIMSIHNPSLSVESQIQSIYNLETCQHELLESLEFKTEICDTGIKSNHAIVNYNSLLFHRELILTRKNFGMVIGRLVVILAISILQSIIIGFQGFYTKSVLEAKTPNLDQFNYLIHLIICYFTCSLFPILFVENFFQYLQIVKNEIDQGWYPSFNILNVKFLTEMFNVILISFLYSIIVYMPFIYYSGVFWIFFLNVFYIMSFMTVLLFITSLSNNSTFTLGSTVLYNSYSFLFNMGYLIRFHNKFTGAMQFLSIMHLQTNSILLYMSKINNTLEWVMTKIDILETPYTFILEPVLISTAYLGIVVIFYYYLISR